MTRAFYYILAGGAGTRLGPYSTPDRPKQFLPLLSQQSMLQDTLERALSCQDARAKAAPTIICSRAHYDMARAECGAHKAAFILEDDARGTAFSIAVGALKQAQDNPRDIMVVMPCDHHIEEIDVLKERLQEAAALASTTSEEILITMGVKPRRAETGLGYIQTATAARQPHLYKVTAFHEKPDAAQANIYIQNAQMYWHAGIFIFTAEALLKNFAQHAPDILEMAQQAHSKARREDSAHHLGAPDSQAKSPRSFDHAILEKTDRLYMSHLNTNWHDVGTWPSLWRYHAAQEQRKSD